MRWVFLLVMLLSAGCSSPVTPDGETQQKACSVTRFEATGEAPVCAIRCVWTEGVASSQVGFADGYPVPCSWYGKSVKVVP